MSVRTKMNASNSADASHAAARPVKLLLLVKGLKHTPTKMTDVRMALF